MIISHSYIDHKLLLFDFFGTGYANGFHTVGFINKLITNNSGFYLSYQNNYFYLNSNTVMYHYTGVQQYAGFNNMILNVLENLGDTTLLSSKFLSEFSHADQILFCQSLQDEQLKLYYEPLNTEFPIIFNLVGGGSSCPKIVCYALIDYKSLLTLSLYPYFNLIDDRNLDYSSGRSYNIHFDYLFNYRYDNYDILNSGNRRTYEFFSDFSIFKPNNLLSSVYTLMHLNGHDQSLFNNAVNFNSCSMIHNVDHFNFYNKYVNELNNRFNNLLQGVI
ncbi:hypothetical protein [Sulfuricurvum sp.]|uniref:hypothetical protein n=1 Tax=Sulfuricurvum sp. TaxID=2025608 RepID=UPI0026064958|nr:hypothetical protein [Sulfuricurvum sp.]MDD4949643.1 hypothetical protein [Sulfuricurvum sp.]